MPSKRDTRSLTPGLILAQAVVDKNGQVLVHEGVEVTKTLMKVLERRGIEEVLVHEAGEDQEYVGGAEQEKPVEPERMSRNDAVKEHQINEMRERLVHMFARHADNQTMAILYATAVDYLEKRIRRK